MKLSAADVADVPPAVVTVISTAPAPPAGEVAVIWVAELTVKAVAAVAPNLTAVAPLRLVPVMITVVPPPVGPALGAIDVTEGAPTYVNWSAAEMVETPPGVVTRTSITPEPAGAVAVMDVDELNVKLVAGVAPKLTAVTPVKLVPVMVTAVPPACGPEPGAMAVTVGAGI